MALMRSPVRSRSGPPTSNLSGNTGVATGGRVPSEEVSPYRYFRFRHDAHQFKDGSRQVVVSPSAMASGTLIFPYALAV